jgi:hypothetical protein|tara:strand:- start:164 stop:382 length:219 start_codon:yes stop_codon:yes gene_type:complete
MKIIAKFPLADGKALRIEGSSQEEFQAMYKFVTRNLLNQRLKKRGLMDVPHVIKALKENKPLSTILEMTSNG